MRLGHICLLAEGCPDRAWFAELVAAISRHEVEQHVLVASASLAERLAGYTNVTVGPIVRSPVLAYCLMPNVEVAHVHDSDSGQAGLLLTLTRSIPFVLTVDDSLSKDSSPLARSVRNRAACTIQSRPADGADLAARNYLEIYRAALSRRSEFPENSNCRQ
ncbi:MAG: hypothetical protein OEW64_08025 [Gammaproteobacteria bacterium]|nr:hypothetical protein [Gammaproteobacteria bacterium]MDH5304031.1 hypothetical protein [Gammaproteobacteria bacterium]MDH5321676.1 hypothetical protein [Gammaproteobacteria bacterium]